VVAVSIPLDHLHGFNFFKTGLLPHFSNTIISIAFKVSDIRYISYIPDIIAQVHEKAVNHIKSHSRAGMTKMSYAINGGTTNIHSD